MNNDKDKQGPGLLPELTPDQFNLNNLEYIAKWIDGLQHGAAPVKAHLLRTCAKHFAARTPPEPPADAVERAKAYLDQYPRWSAATIHKRMADFAIKYAADREAEIRREIAAELWKMCEWLSNAPDNWIRAAPREFVEYCKEMQKYIEKLEESK